MTKAPGKRDHGLKHLSTEHHARPGTSGTSGTAGAVPADYAKLLLDHLDLVDRIVRFVARRHHLSTADAEEFASLVRFRLIDRDFAVLRRFEGRSQLATYLTAVVERFHADVCHARWGKWRPSAAARRLGATAIALEQLLTREGLTFDEAAGTLQTTQQCPETRDELQAMAAQLPVRAARRFASEGELATVISHVGSLDAPHGCAGDEQIAERVDGALMEAVSALPARQQLVLKLRFQEGRSVSEIARMLGQPPKPVYRQLQVAIVLLRDTLQENGVEKQDIERVVGHPAINLGRVFDPEMSAAAGERDRGSV